MLEPLASLCHVGLALLHLQPLLEPLSLAFTLLALALSFFVMRSALLFHTQSLDAELYGTKKTEDDYAYFRNERDFRNYTLTELPHAGPLSGTARSDRDYAVTIVRNFLYLTLMAHLWTALTQSTDTQLAAIASKSIKETRYHLNHASDWLLRFGDGTEESHARAQAAVDYLMPYTREFFSTDEVETSIADACIGPLTADLETAWCEDVDATLAQATLQKPADAKHVSTGKLGENGEHFSPNIAGGADHCDLVA